MKYSEVWGEGPGERSGSEGCPLSATDPSEPSRKMPARRELASASRSQGRDQYAGRSAVPITTRVAAARAVRGARSRRPAAAAALAALPLAAGAAGPPRRRSDRARAAGRDAL